MRASFRLVSFARFVYTFKNARLNISGQYDSVLKLQCFPAVTLTTPDVVTSIKLSTASGPVSDWSH